DWGGGRLSSPVNDQGIIDGDLARSWIEHRRLHKRRSAAIRLVAGRATDIAARQLIGCRQTARGERMLRNDQRAPSLAPLAMTRSKRCLRFVVCRVIRAART